MKTLLILCAAPLALAAMPATANDCTARQPAANEKVLSEMLAYSQQSERTASVNDCRPLVRTVDCVDCPEVQRLQPVTIV
ncbi:hypothetical protein PK98_15125 [Croceibacterium mercuriale]|uniref:Uncharacterized protein n=1 Tax=Croceibacterium mercuriale TaxID=1572751 RepID=A0A0B2BXB6_9SPHN|nr:hypothetical protein [Croceibacterium mercuriale]KHL24291.1 hypothetical protein PK98_15125 [Croceibacterium mercuriale]